MALTFQGHTVEIASNGPEALEKLAKQRFDMPSLASLMKRLPTLGLGYLGTGPGHEFVRESTIKTPNDMIAFCEF